MNKLEASVLVLLAMLALSTFIQEPKSVDWMKMKINGMTCNEPTCVIAKAELGAVFDKQFFDGFRADILNGSTYEALAFLVSVNDEKVREKFSDSIDKELNSAPTGDRQKDLLLLNELGYRVESNPDDNESSAKLQLVEDSLKNNASSDFLYVYIMKSVNSSYAKQVRNNANLSNASELLLKFDELSIGQVLFGLPKSIAGLAGDVENEARNETNQTRLGEDLIAMSYFYLGAYPTLILRGFLLEILAAYALPLFLISVMQAITYLTIRGSDKKALFQRENAKNTILSSLLVLILFPLFVNVLLLFPSPPGVVYLVFIVPVILPAAIGYWMSLQLQKKYGLAESGKGGFVKGLKENIIVAAGGALIAVVVIFFVINIERIFSQLNSELITLLLSVFMLVLLSVFVVMAMPYVIELVAGSYEIKNERMRRGIENLAGRFGYSAAKIRVIPSMGSGVTNAFQSGLLGDNVKVYLSENFMDESKFTEREVEGIVAHELVHMKERHVPKTVVAYISISSFLILLCASINVFLESTGFSDLAKPFALFSSYVAVIVSILATLWIRRRFEYEADRRAAQMGYGDDLASALGKMYESNLMPSSISKAVNFFSSHGALEARIRFLEETKKLQEPPVD